MEIFGAFAVVVWFFLCVFAFFLAILWFILPFAVFGIKQRLDKTNQLLEHIANSAGFVLHETKKTNMILQAAPNVRTN